MAMLCYFSRSDSNYKNDMITYSNISSHGGKFIRIKPTSRFVTNRQYPYFASINNHTLSYNLHINSVPSSSINMYTESKDCFVEDYILAGFYE